MTVSAAEKRRARLRRHRRVRKRVDGTAARPRLAVFRSARHIYAQVIDDVAGRTIAAASTLDAEGRSGNGGNVDAAKRVGALLAQRAREQGVAEVVFDRGGNRYTGRIAALADAARENGLTF